MIMTMGGSWASKWSRTQFDRRVQGEQVGESTGEGGAVRKEARSPGSQSGQVKERRDAERGEARLEQQRDLVSTSPSLQ